MKKHALLSPSKGERWLNCTPSARLEEPFPDTASEDAARGTLAHKVCELAVKKKFGLITAASCAKGIKKLKTDPLWEDEMLKTADIYAEYLQERHMEFQEAPYLAIEVRVDLSDYVPEAFGTCDCVMIGSGRLVIVDYKHGRGIPVSAENNTQLWLYALGALKTYQAIYGGAIKEVVCHIVQPRRDCLEGHSISTEDLFEWGESTVKPRAKLAFDGAGDFVKGDWCRFCRAQPKCRAYADAHTALEDFKDALLPTEENKAAAEAMALDGKPSPPLLTDEEIGDLLTRGKSLVEWYNSMEAYALSVCLAGGTIPGWKAVEGTARRAWSDQDKAIEAILAAGYEKELVYDTKPNSLAQLEKLIGKPFDELVGAFVVKPPGKPTLARESDKRPPYNSTAADFNNIIKEEN